MFEIKILRLFKLESFREEFNEFGRSKIISSSRFSIFGTFSLVTLSKLVFEESNSVLAFISLALAPAKEDSDCAKSVRVISPFCNLALSDSTCLSNKFTFEKLNSSFFILKIKSRYADAVSKIVFCLACSSSNEAFCVSNSDFLNVFTPLKPENIFCSIDTVLLSVSEFESDKFTPFLLVLLVDVVLV